jgi:nucleotide-binding universal stress UspA family protein
LHPTDFSYYSGSALEFACALARDYKARLVLLHVGARPTVVFGEGVVPPAPELFEQEARQRLEQLAVPETGNRIDRRLEQGDPAAEILRVAGEECAELIVMGTHGRSGLSRLLLGSVAESVVRDACCPVLVVRTPLRREAPAPAERAAQPSEPVPVSV